MADQFGQVILYPEYTHNDELNIDVEKPCPPSFWYMAIGYDEKPGQK